MCLILSLHQLKYYVIKCHLDSLADPGKNLRGACTKVDAMHYL